MAIGKVRKHSRAAVSEENDSMDMAEGGRRSRTMDLAADNVEARGQKLPTLGGTRATRLSSVLKNLNLADEAIIHTARSDNDTSFQPHNASFIQSEKQTWHAVLSQRSKTVTSTFGDLNQEETHSKWIFHPHSGPHFLWDILVVAILVWTIFWVPFQLAFTSENSAWLTLMDGGQLSSIQVLDMVLDMIFVIDIIITLRTAVFVTAEDGSQTLESDQKVIAIRYFKSWLIPDLMGTLPWDVVIAGVRFGRLARTPRIAKIIRVFRVLKVGRIGAYTQKIRVFFGFNPAVLSLMKMAAYFLALSHILGCAFFFVGTQENFSDSATADHTWTATTEVLTRSRPDELILVKDAPLDTQYLTSFYWAVTTLSTVGYGDVTSTSTWEMFVSLVAMSIGAAVFSYLVASITDVLSHMNIRTSTFQRQLDDVMSALHANNTSSSVRRQVREYMQFRAYHSTLFGEDNIVHALPASLKEQVLFEMCRPILRSIYLFDDCSDTVLRRLAGKIEEYVLPPSSTIFRTGEKAADIFFIVEGSVKMVAPPELGYREYAEFGKGTFFGEEAVLNAVRDADTEPLGRPFIARSSTMTVLYRLRGIDLVDVTHDMPIVRESILVRSLQQWRHVRKAVELSDVRFRRFARDKREQVQNAQKVLGKASAVVSSLMQASKVSPRPGSTVKEKEGSSALNSARRALSARSHSKNPDNPTDRPNTPPPRPSVTMINDPEDTKSSQLDEQALPGSIVTDSQRES